MKYIFIFLVFIVLSVVTVQAQNQLIINADQATDRINKEIYGHFAEHLGHCIYGGIFVGENSEIPNIRGFRTDVINALKELQVPVVRWPGGCFADTYHWKDGIGLRAQRPSIVNVHWGGVTEDNSFGTHEFLDFCELIGTEPYISINMGSGTVQEASEWVEYVTSSNESPMTSLRKKNGRAEPWKVKYWGIGNETWGCGGNMTPEYAADLHKQIATFLRGPLYKIASGANVEDYHWTETFMQKVSPRLMQGLSLHYYTVCHDWGNKGSATRFNESDWFQTLQKTLKMQELVQKHSTIMDQYDPSKRIGLMVDEWGNWHNVEPGTNPGFLYQQNTLRDALVAGINLNIFNNRADRVKMANIAQMINVLQAVILTKDEKMVLTPTYYVFKLYNVHQDALMIPVSLKSANYTYEGKSIPAVSASASVKNEVISITLCNLDPNNEQKISFRVNGKPVTAATGKVVTAGNITDYNDFSVPEKIKISEFSIPKPVNGSMELALPSKSVVLVQLK